MDEQIQNSNNSNLSELQGMRNTIPLNMHTNRELLLTGQVHENELMYNLQNFVLYGQT
jgi:hypothetical protein